MSIEDLAADCGIVKGTDEFDSFCGCVENILSYGCGYSDAFTEEILDKCRNSELDIAKRVIDELEKPRERYRRQKLKWWQTYVPKNRFNRPARRPERGRGRRPERQSRHKNMNLQFKKKHAKKNMDLQFKKKSPERVAHHRHEYRKRSYKRSRSRSMDRSRSRSRSRSRERSRSRSRSRSRERYDEGYRRSSKYSSVPEWPGRRAPKRSRYRR